MPTYAISTQKLASGNVTFWINGKEQTTGYLCAIKSNERVLAPSGAGLFSRQDVIDWCVDVLITIDINSIDNPFDTVGSWVDEGLLYLDTCKWYPTLDEALVAGHEQNQLAIWDIANQTAIDVVR